MRSAKFLFVVWLVYVASCSAADVARPTGKSKGPYCIAEFCFDVESIDQLMTERELIARFGKGYSEDGKFAFYCYEIPEQKLFVRFRPYHGEQRQIVDIFVSDTSSCPAAKKPNIPLKPLVTREGLKLGDPVEKVISLYGKPSSTAKGSAIEKIGATNYNAPNSSPFGDTVFKYGSTDDGLLRSEVYLRGDTVSAILISVSP
jgi:hypothetical protein